MGEVIFAWVLCGDLACSLRKAGSRLGLGHWLVLLLWQLD